MNQQKFARIPFDASKSPFFYGWWIVVVGTFGVLMSTPGQTIGVSTFTDSLLEALDISRDSLSLAYMFGTLLSASILTKAGKLFDKFGARPVAIVASIGLGLSLLYLSQVDRIAATIGGILPINKFAVVFTTILLGFLFIRFCGQGVLTLASRTMMMKWFDRRRGFAMGFASVFIAWGFSMAPAVFENLIQDYGWRGAWQRIAMVLIFITPVLIFLFFRNEPQDVGLQPDGDYAESKATINKFPVSKDFTLDEARRSLPFWVVTGVFAMQGLYITGFTFHIVSVFNEVGMTRAEAVSIFQPTAIVAICLTLGFSLVADKLKVKYLLYVMCLGGCISIIGLLLLEYKTLGFYTIVAGNGIMTGLYGVVASLALPRFFGRQHLGAIVGQSMTFVVFGSAIGPILFSSSLSFSGTYDISAWVCLILFLLLIVGAFKIKNPQQQELIKEDKEHPKG